MRWFRRRERELRPLDEAEAYERIHGDRTGVRLVHLPPRRKRYQLEVTGEALRKRFEERIAEREPTPTATDDPETEVSAAGEVGDEPVVGEELPGLLEAEIARRNQSV
jgi:hypothetical protein